MDELRLTLLVVGIGVIGLVYWHSRRQARARGGRSETRVEPALDDSAVGADDDTASLSELCADDSATAAEPGEAAAEPVEPEPDETVDTAEHPQQIAQKIVTLRLVAKGDRLFNGEEVVLALRRLGLRHGKFGIFHRVEGTDDESIVFSVASLVEPGTFDLANLRQQELPGVSIFMVLPGPKDGREAFNEMMETARALTDTLGGELLDEAGSTMSIQRERFLREEIIQYQHGLAVG